MLAAARACLRGRLQRKRPRHLAPPLLVTPRAYAHSSRHLAPGGAGGDEKARPRWQEAMLMETFFDRDAHAGGSGASTSSPTRAAGRTGSGARTSSPTRARGLPRKPQHATARVSPVPAAR